MLTDENKFIITTKKAKAATLTIRIDKDINDLLDEISIKTNRSRNEIINLALAFAFNNLDFYNPSNKC